MHLEIEYPETPNGKRTVRKNIYGNVKGYVSGKMFWEFGCNEIADKVAEAWKNGATLEDAHLNW